MFIKCIIHKKGEKTMVIPKKERPPLFLDERDLVRRAYAAYYKKRRPLVPDDSWIDNPDKAEVQNHDGKIYVVVGVFGNSPSEVYRVRNDGVLKCLKRIPKAISDQY
jgi:hypothetical protein